MDRVVVLSATLMAAFACSADRQSPQQTANRGILSEQDLSLTTTSSLSEEQAQEYVQSSSLLRNHVGFEQAMTEQQNSDEFKTCVQAKLNDTKVTHKDNRLIVQGNMNLDGCYLMGLPEESREDYMDYIHDVRFYFELTCDGVDLADLDGMTWGQLSADGTPCEGQPGTGMFHVDTNVESIKKQSLDGKEVVVENGRRKINAMYGTDSGSCRFETDASDVIVTNCISLEKDTTTKDNITVDGKFQSGPGVGEEILVYIKSPTIKHSVLTRERTEGRAEIFLNNWNGKLIVKDTSKEYILRSSDRAITGEID